MTDNRIYKDNRNSGFTLVELIVVLVLMVILLSITIFGGLAWQDWTKFKHENAVAEDIFFVAQNQLTELDNSGALQREVVRPLLAESAEGTDATLTPNGFDSKYVLAYYTEGAGQATETPKFNYKTENNPNGVHWTDVWSEARTAGGISANANDKETRTIISLNTPANKYDEYLKYKNGDNTASIDEDAILLFDLIAPYVTDKSVLNGAIIIEFSPEVGQVLSVCYSDKANELIYSETAGAGQVSVMNRQEKDRQKAMLGYYSVDTLAEKIRGRSEDGSSIELFLINKEVLELVIKAAKPEKPLEDGDKFVIKLYNGKNNKKEEAARFSIDLSDDGIGKINSLPTTLYDATNNDATKDPKTIKMQFKEGDYSGDTFTDGVEFRVPVWWDTTNQELHIVLDAADVQAGTESYLKWKNNKDAKFGFRNTFSFYRFGLSDVKSIYAGGTKNSETESLSMYSNRDYQNDKKYGDTHSGVEGDYYGESPTFYTYEENSSSRETYSIFNARHFYNMRYETEYHASNDTRANTFMLMNNVDWNDFVGKNEGKTINYFLNSYTQSQVGDGKTYGINYSGYSKATKIIGEGSPKGSIERETKDMPFPGFRCLGENDTFTQNENANYVISNLTVSFAANIAYGIYSDSLGDADTIKDACLGSDFSSVLGMSDYTSINSEGSKPARAGKMPLGLFAENLGTISNITLDKHQVIGIETKYASGGDVDSVVATNMVGGFVGNNLGEVSNLTLLNTDGISKVSGRTDVGGIIGRESFTVCTSDAILENLTNKATVSGLENVGGIVGRAYVNYVGDFTTGVRKTYNVAYKDYVSNTNLTEGNEDKNHRYKYYHDGYDITDNKKSFTGRENVSRLKSVTIQNCINLGAVSGDSAFLNKMINPQGTEKAYCSFIGGIAGITMDGYMFDSAQISGTSDARPIMEYLQTNSNFLKGDFSYVTVKNSYSFYSPAIIVENEALSRDNYVGGLVGYARLTAFENCNMNPSQVDQTLLGNEVLVENEVPKCYVLGYKYVGGMIGCSDVCYYAKGQDDNNQSTEYAMTNYNNTIGVQFVGGIAGAFGIGDSNQEIFSFRNPIENKAGAPSAVCDNSKYTGTFNYSFSGRDLLNTAVVLGYKPETSATQYNNANSGTSAIGGIAGALRVCIGECDNYQSEKVKELAYQLIKTGYSDDSSIDTIDLGTLKDHIDSYRFGGYHVGGIAGWLLRCGRVNPQLNNEKPYSYIDAVVFGEGMVGGVVGKKDAPGYTDCRNVFPYHEKNNGSALVVGKTCVGGLIGAGAFNVNQENKYDPAESSKEWLDKSITKKYTVRGVYAVGGLIGYIPTDTISMKVNVSVPEKDPVKVEGMYYTGGYAGVADYLKDQNAKTLSVSLSGMNVSGRYFVGGAYGARYFKGHTQDDALYYIISNDANKRVLLSNTNKVKINAKAFAGGVVGLYGGSGIQGNEYGPFIKPSGEMGTLSTVSGIIENAENEVLDKSKEAEIRKAAVSAMLLSLWGNSDSNTINFTNTSKKPETIVQAEVFAGGLFGFVPDNTNVEVKKYENLSEITTTEIVEGMARLPGGKYSFTGGIVGRIPMGMSVVNCSNSMTWVTDKNGNNGVSKYNPDNETTYVGGLTEVNAGRICGTSDAPLFNSMEMHYGDRNFTVAPFAGVNGTEHIYNSDDSTEIKVSGTDGNTTGVIEYCSNGAAISGGGSVAGIAGAMCGYSIIRNCNNYGKLESGSGSASGIVLEGANTGIETINNCNNTGEITAKQNGAGLLISSNDSLTKGDVRIGLIRIQESVNYGEIKVAEGMACGIAVNTGLGEIELCRNYGLLKKNGTPVTSYGITAGNTSILKNNITTNFAGQSGEITNPIGPGDNVEAELKEDNSGDLKDDSHIRNFYVSTSLEDPVIKDPTVENRRKQKGEPQEIEVEEDGKTIKVKRTTYTYLPDTTGWPVALFSYQSGEQQYKLAYERGGNYYDSGLGTFAFDLQGGFANQNNAGAFDNAFVTWVKNGNGFPSVSLADAETGNQGFRGIKDANYEDYYVDELLESNQQNQVAPPAPAPSPAPIPANQTDGNDIINGDGTTDGDSVVPQGNDNNSPTDVDVDTTDNSNGESDFNEGGDSVENLDVQDQINDETGDSQGNDDVQINGDDDGQNNNDSDDEGNGSADDPATGNNQDAINTNQAVVPDGESGDDSSDETEDSPEG